MSERSVTMAFRLGVTGSTRISASPASPLARQISAALDALRQHLAACAAAEALAGIRSDAPAQLRIVSPLAEGADRLVASLAFTLDAVQPLPDCRVKLDVPLPFGQPEYEQTFTQAGDQPASVEAFRALLAKAATVQTLDGDRDDRWRHASYRAVGRTVVRNCDLLIVITDPKEFSKGPGGTNEIAAYAEQTGVPKLVFDGNGQNPPTWIGPGRSGDALAAAGAYVCQTLLPPAGAHGPPTWLDRARRMIGMPNDPLRLFVGEDATHNFNIWRMRDGLLGGLMRRAGRKAGAIYKPDPGNHWLFHGWRRYRPAKPSSSLAAQLSTKYQQRYRTSYLTVLLAAAGALIIAGFSVGKDLPTALLWIELGLLVLIAIIWALNELLEWHKRYIGYRFLAELQRFTSALMNVGRHAPHGRLDQAIIGPYRWVLWYYLAQLRAAGLKPMTADVETKTAIKADLQRLIDDQRSFHERRLAECKGAHKLLGNAANLLFILTFVCVSVKVVFHPEHLSEWLAVLALVLPILGVAVFTLRAYEEFELLENQSSWLLRELKDAQQRLGSIAPGDPLALKDLGAETVKLVQSLLHDVSGWAQTFTVKAVEG